MSYLFPVIVKTRSHILDGREVNDVLLKIKGKFVLRRGATTQLAARELVLTAAEAMAWLG